MPSALMNPNTICKDIRIVEQRYMLTKHRQNAREAVEEYLSQIHVNAQERIGLNSSRNDGNSCERRPSAAVDPGVPRLGQPWMSMEISNRITKLRDFRVDSPPSSQVKAPAVDHRLLESEQQSNIQKRKFEGSVFETSGDDLDRLGALIENEYKTGEQPLGPTTIQGKRSRTDLGPSSMCSKRTSRGAGERHLPTNSLSLEQAQLLA